MSSNPKDNSQKQIDQVDDVENEEVEDERLTMQEYAEQLSIDTWNHCGDTITFVLVTLGVYIMSVLLVLIMQKSLSRAIRKAFFKVIEDNKDEMTACGRQNLYKNEASVTQDPISFMHIFPFIIVANLLAISWIIAVYKKNNLMRAFLVIAGILFFMAYISILHVWLVENMALQKLILSIVPDGKVVMQNPIIMVVAETARSIFLDGAFLSRLWLCRT